MYNSQKNVCISCGPFRETFVGEGKKLMIGLRSEFHGPEFEPHMTVVGAITLTENDACDKLKKACEGLKAYNYATMKKVATRTFFYQCVFLLLHTTTKAI
ncbi:putative cyclic phosphodiesterase, 2',3'-cyclic-nucleotide 3'-phosphodiesterase [Helianthus anomalus]